MKYLATLMPSIGSQAWRQTTGLRLDEGTWFYMPVLYPGASLSQALEVLQTQGAAIKQIPEVADVLGKIGPRNQLWIRGSHD